MICRSARAYSCIGDSLLFFCEQTHKLSPPLVLRLYRRIEHLESLNAAEREPPATLPISDGSRASSRNSLDGIGGANASALQLAVPLGNTLGNTLGTAVVVTTSAGSVSHGGPVTHQGEGSVSPDEEVQCSLVLLFLP